MSARHPEKGKVVCMAAYTTYSLDTRVRREAETVARETGYRVNLFIPREGDKPRSYEQEGVLIRELQTKQYQGKEKRRYLLSYVIFMMNLFLRITGVFLSGKLALVHIHNMPNFLVFSALIPRIFGKKVVLDIHDTLPETFNAKFGDKKLFAALLRAEERVCTSFATDVICVNHTQKEILVDRGVPEQKINICMNVPDPVLFSRDGRPPEAGRESTGAPFRMIYHGTLVKRLGIDIAIDAVAVLARSHADVEFHIYGMGDDEQEFADMINRQGLENNIILHKAVAIKDLIPVIEGMDVGIVSNRKSLATEIMLPVKMMEYVILGVPVVAPRLKTIQHYFTEEMVEFYEAGSVADLLDKLTRLCEHPELRRERAQKAKGFLDTYGWEKQKMNLLDIYRNGGS